MVNIAINGFGRIGRLVFRIGFKEKDLNFVAINDLTDPKNLAHLLKYDSLHGTWDADIESRDNYIKVNGKEIKILAEKDPTKYPWKELNVDVVVESTGIFRTKEALEALNVLIDVFGVAFTNQTSPAVVKPLDNTLFEVALPKIVKLFTPFLYQSN